MGEKFRGFNFKRLIFHGWLLPRDFEPDEKFCCRKFLHMAKAATRQSRSTRRLSAYVDTMYTTRTFVKWQLLKPYLYSEIAECVLEPGNFHGRNAIAIEKDGILNRWLFATEGIVYRTSVLFF